MSLPEEIQRRVEADEKREDAQKVKVKRFDPRKILGSGIKTVQDEMLGEVTFGELTVSDVFELNRTVKDDQEKGLGVVWLMLKKACPELTFEQVKQYPKRTADRLLTLFNEYEASFLPSKPKT